MNGDQTRNGGMGADMALPIGDRFTMGGATATLAVQRFFKLDAVIAYHYGSFPIIDATRKRASP